MVGMIVINIDSGPGKAPLPEYRPAIAAARAAGADVVAYVDTDNGKRSHGAVVADIELYRAWYGPVGCFFDRAQLADRDVGAYFASLCQYVKAVDPNSTVVLNAGTYVSEHYLSIGDIVVDFEGPCDRYLSAGAAPGWRSRYDPSRFWHIVYDVPRTEVQEVVRAAKSRRTGWLYVTDQAIDDAERDTYLYGRLPDDATWGQLGRLLGFAGS
jgi:Spherulation-specific family 4